MRRLGPGVAVLLAAASLVSADCDAAPTSCADASVAFILRPGDSLMFTGRLCSEDAEARGVVTLTAIEANDAELTVTDVDTPSTPFSLASKHCEAGLQIAVTHAGSAKSPDLSGVLAIEVDADHAMACSARLEEP